jgi:hypothetical protein
VPTRHEDAAIGSRSRASLILTYTDVKRGGGPGGCVMVHEVGRAWVCWVQEAQGCSPGCPEAIGSVGQRPCMALRLLTDVVRGQY